LAKSGDCQSRSDSVALSMEDVSEASLPFEVYRLAFLPGRKLCGFLIQVKHEFGAFRRALDVIAKHAARLKTAHFQSINEGKTKNIMAFIDVTDCTVSPETLAGEIRKARSVEAVTLIKPKIEGFIMDTTSHPLLIGGVRFVILRRPVYKGLIQGVRRRFGSAGEAFLYYTGYEIGLESGKAQREMARQLGVTDLQQIVKNISISFFNCIGFGLAETIKLTTEPFYALIRIYSSFECELGRGAKKPYSQLIRGILAGVLTELFGIKIQVEETKCVAKGDPYCEFEAKPESKD